MGHTALSKIITGATGDEFSHASISFTPTLDPLYSFGTKKLDGKNRELGFIIDKPNSHLWGTTPVSYSVYVTFVNKENYDKMQARMKYFQRNKNSLKYDFPGLVRIFFNMKSKSQKKYFCSRFVAEILSQGREMEKDPSLYRPDTLKGIGNTCLMIKGDEIQKYNAKAAKEAYEKVKKAPNSVTSIVSESTNDLEDDITLESILLNNHDIYYNKDKFDSGEINLCFITGHSGSGKSTMGRDMQNHGIEHYELDDLQLIADHFSMENLKEYGDLIYSYFNGPGKKFYVGAEYLKDHPPSEYEDKLFPEFVHYAMQYAKSHKNTKFVLEGVWLLNKKWFTPSDFTDYAFYIKGTSMLISKIRAAKREFNKSSKSFKDLVGYTGYAITKEWQYFIRDERWLKEYAQYFTSLENKKSQIASEAIYDPPLEYDKLPKHLKNDEVHSWRAKTGIELIHKEPTLAELDRIWANWNLMDTKMKAKSDAKSVELFGITNSENYKKLRKLYKTS